MPTSCTWNGSAWSPQKPVDGDTIIVTGTAALPTGASLPAAGTYALTANGVTCSAASFLPATGGLLGALTVTGGGTLTVDRDFAGITLAAATDALIVDGSVTSSENPLIGDGTLTLTPGSSLTRARSELAGAIQFGGGSAGHITLGANAVLVGLVYEENGSGHITLAAGAAIRGFVATDGGADGDIEWTVAAGARVIIDMTNAVAGYNLFLGAAEIDNLDLDVREDVTMGLYFHGRRVYIASGKTLTAAVGEFYASDCISGGGTLVSANAEGNGCNAYGTINGGGVAGITFRAAPGQMRPRRMGMAMTL